VAVQVRRLEPRDRAVWQRLFEGYIAFYKATVPDPVVETTWQRLLDSQENMMGLVAVDGSDVPIGIAHVIFHRSTWTAGWYCYLEDLFVDPAVRGKGTGRALIEAVYAEADRRRCARTYWNTQEFNYRARMLYDQLATKSPFVQYRR
jgi:GNAT superfamily N-acetyltransferase